MLCYVVPDAVRHVEGDLLALARGGQQIGA
jgi:hypothetical protein